jgi:hypothetical protein
MTKPKKNKAKKQLQNKVFSKNDFALYINLDGTTTKVRISEVHYDTPPNIYYTIEFEDGKNKQTISERLTNYK